MKEKSIRFFSPNENLELQKSKAAAPKEPILTGYISASGKLVLPLKTVENLGIDPQTKGFKVGMHAGKRKLKSLYFIPAQEGQEDVFSLTKGAKSYTMALGVILQKGGVNYSQTKYTFTLISFAYEGGVTGYELQLQDSAPTTANTGKRRGRKPKKETQDA
jgi:hypothetical protein